MSANITAVSEIIENACLSTIAEAFADDYGDSTAYVGDCVAECADAWTSIYTDENIRYALDHDEEASAAVAEGIAMPTNEFFAQHETAGMREYLAHVGSVAEYIANERAIYEELDEIGQVLAARALSAKYGEELDAEAWENVVIFLDALDADRINDIAAAALELYAEALN